MTDGGTLNNNGGDVPAFGKSGIREPRFDPWVCIDRDGWLLKAPLRAFTA